MKSFLKSYAADAILAIVIIGVLAFGLRAIYITGFGHGEATAQAAHAKESATWTRGALELQRKVYQLSQQYRETEQEQAEKLAGLEANYKAWESKHVSTTTRTIADLHTGAIRLRQQLTCAGTDFRDKAGHPRTAALESAAPIRDAIAAFGLQPSDAEFLVRLADDAQRDAEALTLAQQTIKTDRGMQ